MKISSKGDFGDNNFSNDYCITHQFHYDGIYEVKLVVFNNLGSDTISQNIIIDVLDAPIAVGGESCIPSSIELSVVPENIDAQINWYDSQVNGNLLYTGNTYLTDVINTTTTYYVSSTEEISSAFIGESEHQGSNEYSGSANSSGGLIFDTYKSFILESIDVYTDQAGTRKFLLLDNDGNILSEHIEFVPISDDNPHTVFLNFQVNPGLNYELKTDDEINIENFGGTNPQLKRTSNDIQLFFPYTYSNVMSINSSFWYTGNEILTNYYYYFYNWKVKEICSSPKIAVEAKIGSDEVLTINTNECQYDSIILSASGNFTSFEWNNQSSSPTITIYESGEYGLTAYDSLGCIATENIIIPSIQAFEINTNEVLCEGGSIFLQCTSGLNSYNWNTGESTNVISVSNSGIYSVIATDANGCELNDEIEINSIEPNFVDIQTEMDSLIVC